MTGTAGSQLPPPGWYPDGYGLRWWDGESWGPLAPPPGGPMGPPQTEEEAGRTVAVLAQLWPLAAFVLSCFAFAVPLVLYLVQQDKNRFARWHAGEALNSALTVVLLAGVPFVVGWATFMGAGFSGSFDEADPGWPLWLFLGGVGIGLVLGLIALVVGIVGAMRASHGVWWRNPLAIPFVRDHRRERAAMLSAAAPGGATGR